MTTARKVNCPYCGAAVVWGPQSPHRPFCSERCRKIDLGAWASDGYRIAGPVSHDMAADDFSPSERGPTPRE